MPEENKITTLAPGMEIAGGDYRLESSLGAGGFGAVWRATNIQLQKPVALKFFHRTGLTKELDTLVVEEGRKLAQLTQGQREGVEHVLLVHRHVISDRDVPPFLELEFMEGGSLAKKLRERLTLQEDEILSLGTQIGRGLQCAHFHKIIHSDLKPDNILMDAQKSFYKLCDFGLARRLDSMTKLRAGTPAYMSPEQFDAPESVGPPADVYALGIVLYECMEGHPPFPEAADRSRLWDHYRLQHCKQPVPRPRNQQVREELKEIVLSCLAKSQKERATLSDVISRLRDLGVRLPPGRKKRNNLVVLERSGRREVKDVETELRFLPPTAQAAHYAPVRPVTNKDFLRFVRDPEQSRWSPQQVPVHEHDGGYLTSWFQGQPLKGQEQDLLASVPYQAALDFCQWIGGELPDFSTVERLVNTTPELPIVRELRECQQRARLPFLLLWCRVVDLGSDRDGLLYRFGLGSTVSLETEVHRFLRRVRRPRYYCLPFYTFFPVIPTEVVTNLSRFVGDPAARSADSAMSQSAVSDVDKTIRVSRAPFMTGLNAEEADKKT